PLPPDERHESYRAQLFRAQGLSSFKKPVRGRYVYVRRPKIGERGISIDFLARRIPIRHRNIWRPVDQIGRVRGKQRTHELCRPFAAAKVRMDVGLIHRHLLIPAEETDKAPFLFRPEHVKSVESVLPVTRQLDRDARLSEPNTVTRDQKLRP